MALVGCPVCAGLVPSSRTTCLHCDAPLTARWRWLRRVLSVAIAGCATVTLMACYGGPSTIDDCVDLDNDGWFPGCYDEPCDPNEDPYCDCNDGDPGIHPGAADPLGDGLDQDCSGEDGPEKCENGCPDAATPLPDAPSIPDAPDPAPDATQ